MDTQQGASCVVAAVEAPGTVDTIVPLAWGWDPSKWRKLQGEDPNLGAMRGYLMDKQFPDVTARGQQTPQVRKLLSQWPRLQLKDGLLCREMMDPATHETVLQIVVPQSHRRGLWEAYHGQTGHQGLEKSPSLLRRNFYWPGMAAEVQSMLQTCPCCVLRKTKPDGRAPLVPILPNAPLEILAIDFLTLSRPTDRYQNILVMTDLFTKFAWAIPTPDQTALTTARVLWNAVIQPFGCPEMLHSDQGPSFESKLIQELCQMYGCRKSHTTPYHPMGNGTCERWNSTLLNLLGTLEAEQQDRWVDYLPTLVHAYNNSVHSSTGYAPTYLMFGRRTRLPVDMIMGVTNSNNKPTTTSEWVAKHHEHMTYAYRKAREHICKAATKNKHRYDQTARDSPLLPGERVLVWDNRRQGKGKLSDRWEKLPYVVVEHMGPDLPVYKLRPEGKEGPSRILHRNLLHPCLHPPAAQGDPVPADDLAVPATWGLLCVPANPARPPAEPVPPPRRSQRSNLGNPPSRYRV